MGSYSAAPPVVIRPRVVIWFRGRNNGYFGILKAAVHRMVAATDSGRGGPRDGDGGQRRPLTPAWEEGGGGGVQVGNFADDLREKDDDHPSHATVHQLHKTRRELLAEMKVRNRAFRG